MVVYYYIHIIILYINVIITNKTLDTIKSIDFGNVNNIGRYGNPIIISIHMQSK